MNYFVSTAVSLTKVPSKRAAFKLAREYNARLDTTIPAAVHQECVCGCGEMASQSIATPGRRK
jgi:hypothetical protein